MPKGVKYGGRQKGTPNSDKKELRERIAEKYPDYDPVMAMVEIAQDNDNEIDIRLSANKEVAKYIHSQLKSVEVSNPDGSMNNTLTIIREKIVKPASS